MKLVNRLVGRRGQIPSPASSAGTPYRREEIQSHNVVAETEITGTTKNQNDLPICSINGDMGMKILSEPENANVIILLCHGLTGGRETTFTHANGKSWPKDFLAADMPNAMIVTFGYDASVVRIQNLASSDRLRDHGKSMVQALKSLRNEPNRPRLNGLPIVIVAHSLGGLVAEQAYLIALRDSSLEELRRDIRGMMFIGTPHYGSNLAHWGSMLSRLTNAFRRTNSDIIRDLHPQCEILQAVEEDFMSEIINHPHRMKIFCFYEALALTGIGKVVDQDSAIIRGYRSCSIHANHMGMTKFESCQDPDYINIRTELRDWVTSFDSAIACYVEEEQAGIDAERPNFTAARKQAEMNFNGTTHAEKVIQGVYFSGQSNDQRISM